MATFGYAPVSTKSQELARQIDALRAAGVEDKYLYADKVSGAKASRPALDEMLGKLREGDTVVIASLDRLARSTKQLLDLAEKFNAEGVSLVSLHEQLDTRTPQGKFMYTVLAAMAEMERSLIRERQREGIEAAKARGETGGRPRANKNAVRKALALYKSGQYSVSQVAAESGISISTLYRYLRIEKSQVFSIEPLAKRKGVSVPLSHNL